MGFRRKCAETSQCEGEKRLWIFNSNILRSFRDPEKRLLQIKLCLEFYFSFLRIDLEWLQMKGQMDSEPKRSGFYVLNGREAVCLGVRFAKVRRSLWGWWGPGGTGGEENSGCVVFFSSFSLISVGEPRKEWWALIGCEWSRRWAAHLSSLTSRRSPAFNALWSFVWRESSTNRRARLWQIYSNQ